MKDYSAMSDFEINLEVAKLFPELYSLNDEGEPVYFIPDAMSAYSGNDYEEIIFDPCNAWADAGPIIHDNLIGLTHTGFAWHAYATKGDFGKASRNPLRAAMIVFLMMKEQQ